MREVLNINVLIKIYKAQMRNLISCFTALFTLISTHFFCSTANPLDFYY